MITINKQLAQQIVNTVHDLCGRDINFISRRGIIFASTDPRRIGTFHEIGKKSADTQTLIEVGSGQSYEGTSPGVNIPVTHNGSLAAVVGISGDPAEVRKYAHLAERITQLFIREQELSDAAHSEAEKRTFLIHSLLTETLEHEDYLLESLKNYHVQRQGTKRCLLIRAHSQSTSSSFSRSEQKITQFLVENNILLYAFQYPNEFIAIVEESVFSKCRPGLESLALDSEGSILIGVGSPRDIYGLNVSFHTARTALDSLSHSGASFAVFDDLTLELILTSVPPEHAVQLCDKVLSRLSDSELELLETYFNLNQSLALTCEHLYLHKNTVQYKLNRIHRISGLNPRNFRDAVILYLALQLKQKI